MVEYTIALDPIFESLGDKTRRDILRRVSQTELSIKEIASKYAMSFAAVAKHVKVLESARLVTKRKRGKEQLVRANLATLQPATDYLKQYEALWQQRYDRLEALLTEEQ